MCPFQIAANVEISDGNPYVGLFYQSLAANGIEYCCKMSVSRSWLCNECRQIDALHFHWPEYLFTPLPVWFDKFLHLKGNQYFQGIARRLEAGNVFSEFEALLAEAKSRQKRIIWTLHNLEPHVFTSRVQRKAFKTLGRSADLIICHDQVTKEECLRRYSVTGEVTVMRLGNYRGYYPSPRHAEVIRGELGIDAHLPLLVCLGNLRSNKGLDLLCRTLQRNHPQVQILIAGRSGAHFDLIFLQRLCAKLPHCWLLPRALTDQEFVDFAHIADAIVLPYREVTGSGLLLAALTFERGVIAADLPFFRQTLQEVPNAGVLFEPDNTAALSCAIDEFFSIPLEVRRQAARNLADRYDWKDVIKPVTEVIHAWRAN